MHCETIAELIAQHQILLNVTIPGTLLFINLHLLIPKNHNIISLERYDHIGKLSTPLADSQRTSLLFYFKSHLYSAFILAGDAHQF